MRILHTIPDSGWAGREARVLETAVWQNANGHRAWIAAPSNNDLYIHAPKDIMLEYSPATGGIKALRNLVEQLQIDVVDCHGSRDTSAAILAELTVPVVHSCHRLLRESDRTPIQRVVWRGLDRVIAVAKVIESELVAQAMVDAGRIDVIGEWAMPHFFEAADVALIERTRSEIGALPHQPIVAFIGMMREEKGSEVFLRAVALAQSSIPEIKAVVVGANTSAKGTNREELRALRSLWASLGPSEGLAITGFRDDINVILRCADLLVVPSLREAQSRVIPQAFASKTPVVASAIGGITELVTDGVTGWLVPPDDPAALAARIVASIRDARGRSIVAENAHSVARERLALEAPMRSTLATYEKAVQARRDSQRASCASLSAAQTRPEPVNPLSHLHVMIVVAHPDDETLGAAAAMSDFRRLTLVHMTDGAPSVKMAWKRGYSTRGAYARARLKELQRALAHVRTEIDVVNLGIRDQRAALEMPRLTHSLLELLGAYQPDMILTHAFEGGHPDHDATACVVHAAQKAYATRIPIFEMAGYHNAFGIESFGKFIPRDDVKETTIRLAPEAAARKVAMLAEFVSQQRTIVCFPTDHESFRPAPDYDFAERPHEGDLFYERYPFRMTWSRWQQLVKGATFAPQKSSNFSRKQ